MKIESNFNSAFFQHVNLLACPIFLRAHARFNFSYNRPFRRAPSPINRESALVCAFVCALQQSGPALYKWRIDFRIGRPKNRRRKKIHGSAWKKGHRKEFSTGHFVRFAQSLSAWIMRYFRGQVEFGPFCLGRCS